MAQVLKTFEFTGRGSGYPWDEWLDGRVWLLKQGEDFHIPRRAFQGKLGQHRKRLGIKIRSQAVDGGIVIQAMIATEEKKP